MKQISKVEDRRHTIRKNSRVLLEQMTSGQIEVYAGYRRLYRYWCYNNAAVQELKPLFRIPSISPDGILSVTEELNAQIVSIAREILVAFQSDHY